MWSILQFPFCPGRLVFRSALQQGLIEDPSSAVRVRAGARGGALHGVEKLLRGSQYFGFLETPEQ